MSFPGETAAPPHTRANTQLRACAAAFTFLTRIPAYVLVAHDADDLAESTIYFPIVGLVVAGFGALVYWVCALIWPTAVAVVLSMAATVWLTGAFHEDALADAFDGFGGGWDPPQILAIMKDSRVGSYALVGVVLVLLIKAVALFSIASWNTKIVWPVVCALIAGHVLGRWSSLVLMYLYPYVRPPSEHERISAGRSLVNGVARRHVVIATVISAIIIGVTVGLRAIPLACVALLVTVIAGRYFKRRLGGITGDALGAANQMVELCVYLVLSSHWGHKL